MNTFKILFFLLCSNLLFAAQGLFPRGCEVSGFGFDGTNVTVNDQGIQAYFLMHNRSGEVIELERVKEPHAFMSPPLVARFFPNNWAAFASDMPDFHFQCFYIRKDARVKADCREVLDVCRYPRVRFALSNMGNYWVSVNRSQKEVISESTEKGIYLKW